MYDRYHMIKSLIRCMVVSIRLEALAGIIPDCSGSLARYRGTRQFTGAPSRVITGAASSRTGSLRNFFSNQTIVWSTKSSLKIKAQNVMIFFLLKYNLIFANWPKLLTALVTSSNSETNENYKGKKWYSWKLIGK